MCEHNLEIPTDGGRLLFGGLGWLEKLVFKEAVGMRFGSAREDSEGYPRVIDPLIVDTESIDMC